MTLILTALLAYLLGSIPFGLLITRELGLGDLRAIGSGNIGATNVLRTGNKAAAAATLILDAGKGAVAVLLARALLRRERGAGRGPRGLLGHLFPVWLGFAAARASPRSSGSRWRSPGRPGSPPAPPGWRWPSLTRFSSLAALAAAAATPLWFGVFGRTDAVWLGIALAVLVFVRHQANIRRLLGAPSRGSAPAASPERHAFVSAARLAAGAAEWSPAGRLTGDYRCRDCSAGLLAAALLASATPAPAAEAAPPAPEFWEVTGLTAGDTLNLRETASTGAAVVAELARGTVLRNLGCNAGTQGWCEVELTQGGVRGWASSQYLRAHAAAARPSRRRPRHRRRRCRPTALSTAA